MALSLGQSGQWGAGANGGFVWNGQGPAPQITDQEKLKQMGWMSSNPNGFDFGIKTPYNPSMLGGVSTQPVGQPAPGPGGLSSGGSPGQVPGAAPGPAGLTQSPGGNQLADFLKWSQTPAGQQYAAQNNLPVNTGNGGFTTTNPTTAAGVPKYGLIGSEEAMKGGLQGGIAGVEAGMNQAGQTLSPYTDRGAKAFDLQSALSGALGPAAQQQAFANYNQSPEMAYALQQAEKGITRNAAATGSLGSGNVLQELQRNAIGMAQQDYGNAFNRLGSLSAMGQNSANLLGGFQANAGGKVGDYAFGTGQAMASGRTRAGEQIANNVQGTSASLAEMLAKQGNDLSSIVGTGGSNIAQMLANFGQLDAAQQQELAKLLGNIATGSATTVAGASQLPGINDAGILGGIGNAAGGIGELAKNPTVAAGIAALFRMSDIRLKTNIQRIGKTARGNNLYTWDWNDIGAAIAGDQIGFGVIAQEVSQDAVAVGPHGYLMVDYSRV